MLTSQLDEIETQDAQSASMPPSDPTRLETFSKSATGAKMSGSYHESVGFIKRTLGRLSDDVLLEDAGKNQQLLGKAHRLVGSLRSMRSAVLKKLNRARIESQTVFREHGGRFLDGASEFVDDLKKAVLK